MPPIKQKLCINCVNFIEVKKNVHSCDYEYWENKEFKEFVFFVPEFFECDKFEDCLSI